MKLRKCLGKNEKFSTLVPASNKRKPPVFVRNDKNHDYLTIQRSQMLRRPVRELQYACVMSEPIAKWQATRQQTSYT